MAIVTTEQGRPWPDPNDGGGQDDVVDDGAAFHSALLYDLPRGLNNLASYCEPAFQFAMCAGHGLNYSGRPNTWYYRSDSGAPGSGRVFLAQMPVLLPADASTLYFTASLERGSAGIEAAATIDITSVELHLSASPLRYLSSGVNWPTTSGHAHEQIGAWLDADLGTTNFTSKATTAAFGGSASHLFVASTSTGWTDFYKSAVAQTASAGSPVAWLIVSVNMFGAVVADYIKLHEFSLWGVRPGLFDDTYRAQLANGQSSSGSITRELIETMIKVGARPRPIYNFWGGSDAINYWDGTSVAVLKQAWANVSPTANRLTSWGLLCPTLGEPVSSQSFNVKTGSDTVQRSEVGSSVPQPTAVSQYPRDCFPSVVRQSTRQSASGNATQILIGSETANGPQVRSGILFESWNADPNTAESMSLDWIAPGGQIVGARPTHADVRSLRAVRTYWNSLYAARRLAFGWSGILGTEGGDDDGAIDFDVDATSYRYIFDQRIGSGGTTPSITGRGMTVPVKYTAAGIRTRIRLYVRVYAKMSAGTGGTGTLAVYSLDDDNSILGPTALTNGPSITGTTWAWYGFSTPFDPSSDPYFEANATQLYDRIWLCGKSDSGTDLLRIGAFSINAYHSVD